VALPAENEPSSSNWARMRERRRWAFPSSLRRP